MSDERTDDEIRAALDEASRLNREASLCEDHGEARGWIGGGPTWGCASCAREDGRPERPDALDEINAFRAGYHHGVDRGEASRSEAEAVLRSFGRPVNDAAVSCFCNGSIDGAKGDRYRWLLTHAVAP